MKAVKVTLENGNTRYMTRGAALTLEKMVSISAQEDVELLFECTADEYLSVAHPSEKQ